MSKKYFHELSCYSAWANSLLLDSCKQLSEEEYFRKRPSFFGSIHLTLNHLLVGNHIWMFRLGIREQSHSRLDLEVCKTFEDLKYGLDKADKYLETYCKNLKEDKLDTDLEYQLISKPEQTGRTPLNIVLGHVFNHQTHHRGQVHDMLSQTSVAPPSLDLIYFSRN